VDNAVRMTFTFLLLDIHNKLCY